MQSEATAIIEAVRAALILAATFGIAINAEQQAAIVVIVGAGFTLVSALLAYLNRQKVYAVDTTQQIANDAASGARPFDADGNVDIGTPPSGGW